MSHEEEVFFEGRIPVKAFLGAYGFWLSVLFGWNILLLAAYMKRLGSKLLLTNARVVVIHGLIAQKEEDVALYRAQDISFRQKFFERILGTGSVTVISDDPTAPELTFLCIKPREVKEELRTAMMEQRKLHRTIQMD